MSDALQYLQTDGNVVFVISAELVQYFEVRVGIEKQYL